MNPIIEEVLNENKPILRQDYEKYRNHVYRVFYFCVKIDSSKENKEKYAIASVFHDLGIWTDQTFDYLAPSVQKAQEYLVRNKKVEWVNEITLMIEMHHKITSYHKNKTVETFRQADWIDVTKGIISFQLNRSEIKKAMKDYPNSGFHLFLLKQTFKNFVKHPFNPLPMFKK